MNKETFEKIEQKILTTNQKDLKKIVLKELNPLIQKNLVYINLVGNVIEVFKTGDFDMPIYYFNLTKR